MSKCPLINVISIICVAVDSIQVVNTFFVNTLCQCCESSNLGRIILLVLDSVLKSPKT